MIIFPLSWPAKIVLILIAAVLGLILSMLQWPHKWRWLFDKLREDGKLNEDTIKKVEQRMADVKSGKANTYTNDEVKDRLKDRREKKG